ncbi:MAG: flagellar biogenesis protein FliO [Bacteroidia bacterium]
MKNNTHPNQTPFLSPLGALFGLPFLASWSPTQTVSAEKATDGAIDGATNGTTEGATDAVTDLVSSFGSPTAGVDMTQYTLVCVGLVVAILGLAWAFRRVVRGNLRGRANRRSMQVIDMLPLGGKRHLAVVRCYDRTLVLGLGESDVSLVTELDADQDVEGSLEKLIPAQAATKNKEEAAAPMAAATTTPKVGLFSSILATARKGIEKRDKRETRGSGESRVQSAAQASASAAVVELTSVEESQAPAPAAPKARETMKTQEPASGGWVG